MKQIIAGYLLLFCSMPVMAECSLISSTQNIDYGKRSAAMRQADRGSTTQLTGQTITMVMQCDQRGHVRLQLTTSKLVNGGFGFGANGTLNLVAANAVTGSDSLDLALASSKSESLSGAGASSVTPNPNSWLAFMQNGQEAVIDSGNSISVSLTIAPSFKDETAITDLTEVTGNLTAIVEAQ